jgi:hypothetical protein
MRLVKSIVVRSTFVLLSAVTLMAQTSTSEITGTVRDTSGAVIPGATVTAANEATGVVYKQTTTNAGLYAFSAVPAAAYTISVEMPGFKMTRKIHQVVVVNTPLTVDLTLEVGQATETVNVESTAVQLQTENAAVGNVVTEKAIKDLPLNGRNPFNLLTLEPGVTQRSAGGVGSGISVNGSRDRAFNVTIDGIEANESTVPNPLSNLYRLTPDNVQEYKVTTNNATPEEGRNSGAAINVATKSGTNQIHGTLFEFFRNTKLNSNEFFANAQGTPKPDIKLNQFGGQVSGPIIKNKTFFFFSYADNKINVKQPIDQTFGAPSLYTPSARSGIYRYFVADPRTPFVLNGTRITRNSPALVDSHTGALLPGVRNCASPTDANCVASFNFAANDPKGIGVDPTIGKLFSTYPLPNNYGVGDGLNTASYQWNPPTRYRGPNYMGRIDHQFNENNNIFGRLLLGHYNTLDGDPLNGRPQVFPGFPPLGEVYRTTRNLAVSYRHLFSPRVVNELTGGFSRFIFLFTQGEANPSFPNVPAYSFTNVSLPFINTPRTFRAVTTPQLIDNVSIIKGAHIFRFGANIRLYQHNDQRGQPGGINVTPSLSFATATRPPAGFNTPAIGTSSTAGINSTDNTRLLGTINEVMGIPARLSQVFLGDLKADNYLPFIAGNKVTLWNEGTRLKQYDFFVQDEWRLRRNVVVNYGLRWEINTAPTESGGRVYIPSSSIINNPNLVTFVHADRWFKNNNVDAFAPRIGITYSPGNSGKTVIRAGYGIAFDPLSSFEVTAVAGKVPGLTLQCSSTVGAAATPGCQSVPDIRIAQGFPNQLAPPTTKPTQFLTPPAQVLTNAPALTVFDQNFKLPTVHQWSLTIQRELPGGFLAQVGYIGHRGMRLQRAYDVNQINADPILPSFLIMQQNFLAKCNPDGTGCPAGVTGKPVPLVTSGIVNSAFVNSSTTQTDLTQNGAGNFVGRIEQTTTAGHFRPNQQFGVITYLDSGGDSYYHSFQARLTKRYSNGLLFGLSYTLAKSIDDQSVDPVGSSSGGGLSTTTSRAPVDIRNWRNERALSDFDRTHVITINSVYELPVGKGKHFLGSAPGFVNQIVGGWSVAGLYTHMTGEPFSVTSGVRTANFSHTSRADIVGATPSVHYHEVAGVVGPVVFDDVNQFAFPAPGGDGAGRNIFRAAPYWNLDLSAIKDFHVTERFKLQFRMEAFNALNHANFDNPRDASVGSPSLTSSVFAQTCCATVAPPTTQSIIQTGESSRVVQLALKLDF